MVLLACSWLLAAGTSEETESGACLLQHGSAPVRAALIHESKHGSGVPVRASLAHDNMPHNKIHKGSLLDKASTKRQDPAVEGAAEPLIDGANILDAADKEALLFAKTQSGELIHETVPAVEGAAAPLIDEANNLDAADNEALLFAEELNTLIKDNSAEKLVNQVDEADALNEANEASDLDTQPAIVNEGAQHIDQAIDLDTANKDLKLINGATDVVMTDDSTGKASDADDSAAKPSKQNPNENSEGAKDSNTESGANEAEQLEKEDEKKEEKENDEKKEKDEKDEGNGSDETASHEKKSKTTNDEDTSKGKDDEGKEDKKKEKGNKTVEGDKKIDVEEEEEAAPGASLRLELWLPISINDLKSDKKGPMSVFLDTLQRELARVANVSAKRFDMLGVRGEYTGEGVLSFFARDVKASLQEGPVVAIETTQSQSIVDLEVLPATQADDVSPKAILSQIEEQLADEDSSLMKGAMKDSLKGAKVNINQGVEGLLPRDQSGAPRRCSRLPPLLFFAMVVPALALLLD